MKTCLARFREARNPVLRNFDHSLGLPSDVVMQALEIPRVVQAVASSAFTPKTADSDAAGSIPRPDGVRPNAFVRPLERMRISQPASDHSHSEGVLFGSGLYGYGCIHGPCIRSWGYPTVRPPSCFEGHHCIRRAGVRTVPLTSCRLRALGPVNYRRLMRLVDDRGPSRRPCFVHVV
ncbi:hypothetical protein BV20DRAFT_79510 [Pilatotrama ljubarskyi]|nr:hypothetical protein BV20DRAFT_79510 [Pilatotrama ljubarskyi]